jgi:hypothetical protein
VRELKGGGLWFVFLGLRAKRDGYGPLLPNQASSVQSEFHGAFQSPKCGSAITASGVRRVTEVISPRTAGLWWAVLHTGKRTLREPSGPTASGPAARRPG